MNGLLFCNGRICILSLKIQGYVASLTLESGISFVDKKLYFIQLYFFH